MERKIIISLVSGYLVSMLPIWMIGSRMQEIILTFAVSFCILSGLIWIEERIQDMKKTNPEAEDCARKIINGVGWEVQTETINKNMSEAAAKAWHESVKNNKGIM